MGGGLVDWLVACQRPCDLVIRKFLNLKMNLDELHYNIKLHNFPIVQQFRLKPPESGNDFHIKFK